MKFEVTSYTNKRIKLSLKKKTFTKEETIKIIEYIKGYRGVASVTLYNRIGDMKIIFSKNSYINSVLDSLSELTYEEFNNYQPSSEALDKQRELMEVKAKIKKSVLMRYVARYFLPNFIGRIRTYIKAFHYLREAYASLKKRKLNVSVLDATAIAASIVRNDYATANSIMFLLHIGDLLDDYTHKKVVADLSRSLALNIDTVWILNGDVEIEVPFESVKKGDLIKVRAGSMIPCDATVTFGVAMVNEATLTGESVPVKKDKGKSVFAGTVVEEGEIIISVTQFSGQARIDEIVHLIENSEKNQSEKQLNAYRLADRLVKYSFLGFGLAYGFTRNISRALAFLMVDYSCALKLATPIAIMSAMKECGDSGVIVKGGKYLENLGKADVIIFDKTGTLTQAVPSVKKIIALNGFNEIEVLRIAACLEEHFPHSIANAVVKKAIDDDVAHEELHGEVKYIVAHGIASEIMGEKAIIGSHHFIFEDEKIEKDAVTRRAIEDLPNGCSYLYLAVNAKLIGILCIEDPLKNNAVEVISRLKELGFYKTVMLTGDNESTARQVALETGIDEYVAEVLPADKSDYVQKEIDAGHTVIMIGDGVNDSPALSLADVGISMGSSSDIAREVADVIIKDDDLAKLVFLRKIATSMRDRINSSYQIIVGVNSALIGLGFFNVIAPNSSALFHNATTVLVGSRCMLKLEEEEENEEYDFKASKYFTPNTIN